jgi:hypothetical protein
VAALQTRGAAAPDSATVGLRLQLPHQADMNAASCMEILDAVSRLVSSASQVRSWSTGGGGLQPSAGSATSVLVMCAGAVFGIGLCRLLWLALFLTFV